jgi:Holliday junction resolvase
MSAKSRGITAERELVHLLQAKGFAAIRIAGSGSTKTPSADVLAGNGMRVFAFECKTTRDSVRYISKEAVADFVQFSRQFGAESWIAMRFPKKPWWFILPEDLEDVGNSFKITLEFCEKRGISLDELLNTKSVVTS